MSVYNYGDQKIGWKYSTPLKADYLSTFIAGFSQPGLVTRPAMIITTTETGANVTIRPFSLLIQPSDMKTDVTDENGNNIIVRLAKVTTESNVTVPIDENTRAIGFRYMFKQHSQETGQSEWYGDFVALDTNAIRGSDPFEGIIIATCMCNINNDTSDKYFSVTTSGADISDLLLKEEGWNPNCWVSLVSPRRAVLSNDKITYTKLELRNHNSSFASYVNGTSGCNYISAPTYTFINNGDVTGIYESGVIYHTVSDTKTPFIYNGICFNSNGLTCTDYGNSIPLSNTQGGILAIAESVHSGSTCTDTLAESFTNRIKLYPCIKEQLNIYVSDNTLYIK